jgi:outer membrane protein OmpA-like peptidoglycan-associated protein
MTSGSEMRGRDTVITSGRSREATEANDSFEWLLGNGLAEAVQADDNVLLWLKGEMSRRNERDDATDPITLGATSSEAGPLAVAGLGIAVFNLGRALATSGDLAFESQGASYVHQGTPPDLQFRRYTTDFRIDAYHVRYGFDWQHFWFRLSFEYNGYDIRNASVNLLEGRSSSMIMSTFSIRFSPQSYSAVAEPVARIVYNISGKWDPVGTGVFSFSGELHVGADGTARITIQSEEDNVRAIEFTKPVITALPVPAKITSRGDVTFPVRSADLSSDSVGRIKGWYEGLPQNVRQQVASGATPIDLHGFASTTGSVVFNQGLSRARVEAVQRVLRDFTGSNAKFNVYAHGETGPHDETEDAAQRRVSMEATYYVWLPGNQ